MSKASTRFIADKDTFNRLFEAAKCNTQVELADFLGVKQSTISYAKSQKSIPADWLMIILLKRRVNPYWILGKDSLQYLYPSESEEIYLTSIANESKNNMSLHDFSNEELMQELASRMGNKVSISLVYKP